MKRNIRIVHISKTIKGGAGTAAYRLHTALLKNGFDSVFLSMDVSSDNKMHFQITTNQTNGLPTNLSRIIARLKEILSLGLLFSRKYFYSDYLKVQKFLYAEVVSLPFSLVNLLEQSVLKDADVIHFHWMSEILDFPSFFLKNKKPLVWTLHDMNPIQGLYHYQQDEILNNSISHKLNAFVKKLKYKSILKSNSSIEIISPSRWLFNETINSGMFKQHKLHLIHYTIDSDVFYCDSNTQALKIKHKIPLCNTVFLFVAENINNRRKGFDLLLESLNRLVDNNITVLLIGDSQSEFSSSIDIRLIGNINSNVKLREYYSLADAFIIPSREDNLPNVMLESLMCGTPVLCFNIGGMKDIIIDGFNGLKADKTDSNDLYNIITLFIKSKTQYNRKEIHLHALNLFSESIIVNKYKDVYDNIVNETRSGNRL